MGSCLSKSGKKAKDADDDRMPHSPPDKGAKGKYKVKGEKAPAQKHEPENEDFEVLVKEDSAGTAAPASVRKAAPVEAPPPVPVATSDKGLETVPPIVPTAISNIDPGDTGKIVLVVRENKSPNFKKPIHITDVVTEPAHEENIEVAPSATINKASPVRDQNSPTRASLGANKQSNRDIKPIPVASPTVPTDFVYTENDIDRSPRQPVVEECSPTEPPVTVVTRTLEVERRTLAQPPVTVATTQPLEVERRALVQPPVTVATTHPLEVERRSQTHPPVSVVTSPRDSDEWRAAIIKQSSSPSAKPVPPTRTSATSPTIPSSPESIVEEFNLQADELEREIQDQLNKGNRKSQEAKSSFLSGVKATAANVENKANTAATRIENKANEAGDKIKTTSMKIENKVNKKVDNAFTYQTSPDANKSPVYTTTFRTEVGSPTKREIKTVSVETEIPDKEKRRSNDAKAEFFSGLTSTAAYVEDKANKAATKVENKANQFGDKIETTAIETKDKVGEKLDNVSGPKSPSYSGGKPTVYYSPPSTGFGWRSPHKTEVTVPKTENVEVKRESGKGQDAKPDYFSGIKSTAVYVEEKANTATAKIENKANEFGDKVADTAKKVEDNASEKVGKLSAPSKKSAGHSGFGWRSPVRVEEKVVVVEKENGGKSDFLSGAKSTAAYIEDRANVATSKIEHKANELGDKLKPNIGERRSYQMETSPTAKTSVKPISYTSTSHGGFGWRSPNKVEEKAVKTEIVQIDKPDGSNSEFFSGMTTTAKYVEDKANTAATNIEKNANELGDKMQTSAEKIQNKAGEKIHSGFGWKSPTRKEEKPAGTEKSTNLYTFTTNVETPPSRYTIETGDKPKIKPVTIIGERDSLTEKSVPEQQGERTSITLNKEALVPAVTTPEPVVISRPTPLPRASYTDQHVIDYDTVVDDITKHEKPLNNQGSSVPTATSRYHKKELMPTVDAVVDDIQKSGKPVHVEIEKPKVEEKKGATKKEIPKPQVKKNPKSSEKEPVTKNGTTKGAKKTVSPSYKKEAIPTIDSVIDDITKQGKTSNIPRPKSGTGKDGTPSPREKKPSWDDAIDVVKGEPSYVIQTKTIELADGQKKPKGVFLGKQADPKKNIFESKRIVIKNIDDNANKAPEGPSVTSMMWKVEQETANDDSNLPESVASKYIRSAPTSPGVASTSPTSRLPTPANSKVISANRKGASPTSPAGTDSRFGYQGPTAKGQITRTVVERTVITKEGGKIVHSFDDPYRDVNFNIDKDSAQATVGALTARPDREYTINAYTENLTTPVQSLLYDGGASNRKLMEAHEFLPGTRKSLLQSIDNWYTRTKGSRTLIVYADGGMGKTCLAGEVCNRYRQDIVASHFFDYKCSDAKHNKPRYVIQSLASMFCDNIRDYIQELPAAHKMDVLLNSGNVEELFTSLFTIPLAAIEEQNSLIVIDALDQCDPSDRDLFYKFLGSFQDNTPSWLNLLVFTRGQNKVLNNFGSAMSLEIQHNDENAIDMKNYLRQPLSTVLDRNSLDVGLNQLVKKSQGLFLYCAYIKDVIMNEIGSQQIALRHVDKIFPNGVHAMFEGKFAEFKDQVTSLSDKPDNYSSVVGPVLYAVGPLPDQYLAHVYEGSASEAQDSLLAMKPLITHSNGHFALSHKVLFDWLLDKQSGDLHVDHKVAAKELSVVCNAVFDNLHKADPTEYNDLKCYALVNMVRHTIDVPSQQAKVAEILTDFDYIQGKLCIPGITIDDIKEDYLHEHWTVLPSGEKLVSLESYMKNHPKLLESMAPYYAFLDENEEMIESCPEAILQLAANSWNLQNVQQNARSALSSKPWFENLTNIAETYAIVTYVNGIICDADMSPDGKTVAIISKDDYNVSLSLYSTKNGELTCPDLDLKALPDRVGLMVKFIPETSTLFIGSLTTFVTQTGKTVPSGIDLDSIALKEKYTIECCDASEEYLACSLDTFPFGGRSIYLTLFDLAKRMCIHTLEVLKFRFGGSSQFGIKAVSICREKPLLAACIKQSTKPALLVNIWSTETWSSVASIEMAEQPFTKCILTADTMFFSGSLTSTEKRNSVDMVVPLKTLVWKYKENDGKPQNIDMRESHGLLARSDGSPVRCSWLSQGGPAHVSRCTDCPMEQGVPQVFNIRGLDDTGEVFTDGNIFVAVSLNQVRMYNFGDMESVGDIGQTSETLLDLVAREIMFLPKSDTLAIVQCHDSLGDLCTVKLWDARMYDATDLQDTPFMKETVYTPTNIEQVAFFGKTPTVLQSSADGNILVFNNGSHIQVWDRISNSVTDLHHGYGQYVISKPSSKDNILAVVSDANRQLILIYDLKYCSQLNQIEAGCEVEDFCILSSHANIITHHKDTAHPLRVHSIRTGATVSSEISEFSYARVSPTLDRMALCVNTGQEEGGVLLRSSDNRTRYALPTPGVWHPDPQLSDLEFSTDGTILIGTCAIYQTCRLWNAGNGDVLRDISKSFSLGVVSIAGMLTNTHLVLQDGQITVVDIASGIPVAHVPLGLGIERKPSPRALAFCSRSNTMALADQQGKITVYMGHNFLEAKRQTSLQRIKSFRT